MHNLGPVSNGTHFGKQFNVISQIRSNTSQEMRTASSAHSLSNESRTANADSSIIL
jgi:hypothetical protein